MLNVSKPVAYLILGVSIIFELLGSVNAGNILTQKAGQK